MARPLIEEYRCYLEEMEDIERRVAEMPDLAGARVEVQRCERLVRESDVSGMQATFREHESCQEEVFRMEERLGGMPDLRAVAEAIGECGGLIARLGELSSKAFELTDCLEEMDQAQERLDECEIELNGAFKERNAAISDVDVCPLTGAAISGECLKGVKFPVMKGEDR